jgi:hypothetical protein
MTNEETFVRALRALLKIARIEGVIDYVISQGQTVNYIELAKPLGMFSGGSELADLLGKIFAADVAAGKPSRTAAVIRTDTGMPGFGFYDMAVEVAHCGNTMQAKVDFWLDAIKQLGLTPPPSALDTIAGYRTKARPCSGDGITQSPCGLEANHEGTRNGIPVRTCGVHIVGAENMRRLIP